MEATSASQTYSFTSEEQASQWFREFNSIFQRHQAQNTGSNVSIPKLPACHSIPVAKYTPQLWQFGLHNRDVINANESEALKIALAEACELGPWDQFCESIVNNPGVVLREYGLDDRKPKFSEKQVQYLLTLDALTIVLVGFGKTKTFWSQEGHMRLKDLLRSGLVYNTFWKDLYLFENQIPIFLLKKVINNCYENLPRPYDNKTEREFLDVILKAHASTMCTSIFVLTEDNILARIERMYPMGELEVHKHNFDCVYRVICGDNWGRKKGGSSTSVRSATDLKKPGIQIKGHVGMLDEVKFEKRRLSLPIIKLVDLTECWFRNLAMCELREGSASTKCAFGEYLHLMMDLIKGPEDVKHLIKCGVIQNYLQTDISAFEMWNSLQSGVLLHNYSETHIEMVSKINS